MAIETHISEADYERLALAEPERKWELRAWRLEAKPGMTWEHSAINVLLGHLLLSTIDRARYEVLSEVRVRCQSGTIYIPDLVVAPISLGEDFRDRPGRLAVLTEPLPLVIEVWSASTGDFDFTTKIPEYQRRGDLEIWRIHPYERTLTAWRRLPDGSYEMTILRDGIVKPAALPGVAIDLGDLFRR